VRLLAYLWKFFRTLHGPAARDSVRNVLAVLGLAAGGPRRLLHYAPLDGAPLRLPLVCGVG
jgi:hypothetical protein